MDSAGKLILESILETKATTILQFVGGLHGSLLVTGSIFWVVVGSVLEMLSSRGVSNRWSDPVCFGTESPLSRYAPSENQK